MMFDERILDRMEFACLWRFLGQAFDCCDLRPYYIGNKNRTRLYGQAVKQDRTRTAIPSCTTKVGAGEVELISQKVN